MKNKYNLTMVLAILVVILIAGYLLVGANTNKQKSGTQTTNPTQNNQNAGQTKQLSQENITLSTSGFTPQTLTVKPGTRVVWTNKSGVTGTVNSDNHPTNLLFPFLNLGRFNNDSSVTVMLTKSGKYTYHNELNPDQKGTIIVK
jgi:plastocyanin